MKLDMTFRPGGDLSFDAKQIQQAEALGFDAAWAVEAARNPFFPLTLAAKITSNIRIGTQAAAASPRSPMISAQIAWDLARQSGGRFVLGLGTQIPGRQFSEEWTDPIGRMREYIESIRAIQDTFQTGARLRYRGKYYQFRLMLPFFNPGPIEHPDIPIHIAAVSPNMCQLAGEVCQGAHVPGFHTVSYLKEVIQPQIEQGLSQAGRKRSDFALTAPVFVVTGETPADRQKSEKEVKARIAFYASQPAHQAVMAHHGWDNVHIKLRQMAGKQAWEDMPPAVSDEIFNEVAIIAAPEEAAAKIRQRYAGLVDRVGLEWQAGKPRLMEMMAKEPAVNQT